MLRATLLAATSWGAWARQPSPSWPKRKPSAERGQWALNEKDIVRPAGLEAAETILRSDAGSYELAYIVERVRDAADLHVDLE